MSPALDFGFFAHPSMSISSYKQVFRLLGSLFTAIRDIHYLSMQKAFYDTASWVGALHSQHPLQSSVTT